MSRLRRALTAAALAMLALLPTGAGATGTAAALHGHLVISCYGCGFSTGRMSGTAAGVVNARPVAGAFDAYFEVYLPYQPDGVCTHTVPMDGTIYFDGTLPGSPTPEVARFSGTLFLLPGAMAALLSVQFEGGTGGFLEIGGGITSPFPDSPCHGSYLNAFVEGGIQG